MPLDLKTAAQEKCSNIDACEHLLLRSFRRWTLGLTRSDGAALEATWNDLACVLGPGGARATLDALSSLVFRLAGRARRVIRHHHPCCPRLTWDEWCLLSLVSACQRRKAATAEEAAVALAGAEEVEPILESARALAEALLRSGQVLPDRNGGSWRAAVAYSDLRDATIH